MVAEVLSKAQGKASPPLPRPRRLCGRWPCRRSEGDGGSLRRRVNDEAVRSGRETPLLGSVVLHDSWRYHTRLRRVARERCRCYLRKPTACEATLSACHSDESIAQLLTCLEATLHLSRHPIPSLRDTDNYADPKTDSIARKDRISRGAV